MYEEISCFLKWVGDKPLEDLTLIDAREYILYMGWIFTGKAAKGQGSCCRTYKTDLMRLLTPLSEYSQEVLLDRGCAEQIRQSKDDMRLNVWYPARTATECVIVYSSFLPVFLYTILSYRPEDSISRPAAFKDSACSFGHFDTHSPQ